MPKPSILVVSLVVGIGLVLVFVIGGLEKSTSNPSPTPDSAKQLKEMEQKLKEAERRSKEAERDLDKLMAAMPATKGGGGVVSPPTQESILAAHKILSDRYKRAHGLIDSKNYPEALTELLACFKEGANDGAFGGVRLTFLLLDLARLGKNYPPARTALLELRSAAELAAGDPANKMALRELVSLDRALKEEGRSVDFFDRLPPDDARRPVLGKMLYAPFVQAQRYADAVQAQPYLSLLQNFQHDTSPTLVQSGDAKGSAAARAGAVMGAAAGIEALAGSGHALEAQQLITAVLAFDPRPATYQVLRDHLVRAGRPDLMPAGVPPK